MKIDKLNRLKEVLGVPTHSRNEDLMIKYLKEVLTEKGYDHYVDEHGNVYATKGESEAYPCFISHTDTVHRVDHNLTIVEEDMDGELILRGRHKETNSHLGCGGDDKCGVFLCLEMLDTLDNVKAAFFVSEEIGCLGSKHADPEFFKNVGYCIQYDSPEGDSMSYTLMGMNLFKDGSEFNNKTKDLITESGITKWAHHPYTDVWQIVDKFGISCLNLAAGYYNYHTSREYVLVSDVEKGFELGLQIVETLGETRHETGKKKEIYGMINEEDPYGGLDVEFYGDEEEHIPYSFYFDDVFMSAIYQGVDLRELRDKIKQVTVDDVDNYYGGDVRYLQAVIDDYKKNGHEPKKIVGFIKELADELCEEYLTDEVYYKEYLGFN